MKNIRDKKQFSTVKNDDLYVARAKMLVELNYNQPDFSIEQISEALHLSQSRLCDVFKRKTGTTLIKYITAFRMKKAAEMLTMGCAPITTVAQSVGYDSSSYFSSVFRAQFKMSPADYRRAARKGE